MSERTRFKVEYETDSRLAYLRECVLQFIELCAQANIEIRASETCSFRKKWNELPVTSRSHIVNRWGQYVDLLQNANIQGVSLADDQSLTWSALRYLDLVPPSDFFDKIKDGDIVECYNRENVQIYRNLRFFEFCSYSVFDVLVHAWPELYFREAEISRMAFDSVMSAAKTLKDTRPFEVPVHTMSEIFSDERRSFICTPGVFASLRSRKNLKSKNPDAVILTCRCERRS